MSVTHIWSRADILQSSRRVSERDHQWVIDDASKAHTRNINDNHGIQWEDMFWV
jgi:hypothetical protein